MARSLVVTWVLLLCALLSSTARAQLPADAPRGKPPALPLVPASTDSLGSVPEKSSPRPFRRGWHPAARVTLEAVGGAAGELAGLIAAFPLAISTHGSVICVLGDDNGDCEADRRQRGFLVMMLTISVGETLGVYGAGTLAGGKGQLLPTIGGALLGTGAALGVYRAAFNDNFFPGMVVSSVLPPLGAILGYELSHALSGYGYWTLESPRSGSSVRLVPIMGRSSEGSLMGGLAGQF
jgi:hypothetical protein